MVKPEVKEVIILRGSIKKRGKDSFSLIVDMGYVVDPETGKKKRKQKWITFKGTKKQAEAKLAEIINDMNKEQFIEPSKITFGEWLLQWLDNTIKPKKNGGKRPRTYETYKDVIDNHLMKSLGLYRLQQLKASHIKAYYDKSSLSSSTLQQHHTVISGALEAALADDLVHRNEAKRVKNKPHSAKSGAQEAIEHCWTAEEVDKFLKASKDFGPQAAAFYHLALDTGMRKAELCGLRWNNVDIDTGKVAVVEQLTKTGNNPEWGPPKNDVCRTITIAPETVSLLKKHKANQAGLKMRNRKHYHDHGLVFAKEWEHMQKQTDCLGHPLQMNNLGQREYLKIIKAAGVRKIKFHGMRHTCATLLLENNVPFKVVQERLGHKDIGTLLTTYAHVTPSMQKDAALKMQEILYGKK